MKCMLFGGSGEVGGAVACELIKSDACSQLTMLGRRAVPAMQGEAKIEQFKNQNAKDPAAFLKSEEKRVDPFMVWHRWLILGWSVLVVVGLTLVNFWGGPRGRAIGLAVVLFGITGLMADHTSQHNAKNYHAEIYKALGP